MSTQHPNNDQKAVYHKFVVSSADNNLFPFFKYLSFANPGGHRLFTEFDNPLPENSNSLPSPNCVVHVRKAGS